MNEGCLYAKAVVVAVALVLQQSFIVILCIFYFTPSFYALDASSSLFLFGSARGVPAATTAEFS